MRTSLMNCEMLGRASGGSEDRPAPRRRVWNEFNRAVEADPARAVPCSGVLGSSHRLAPPNRAEYPQSQPRRDAVSETTADQQPCNQSDTDNGQRVCADLIARGLCPLFFHSHEVVVLCVQRALRVGRRTPRAIEAPL